MFLFICTAKELSIYAIQLDNLTDSCHVPNVLVDKTNFQQTLPISLNASKFDSTLLTTPQTLKDFVHQYCKRREIFGLKERHIAMNL